MKYYDVSAMTGEGKLIELGTYPSREEAYDAAYDAVEGFEYDDLYAEVTVFQAWSGEVELQLHTLGLNH